MLLPVMNDRPVLGRFDKGIDGCKAVNYGLSGASRCSQDCPYHPKNKRSQMNKQGRCYGIRIDNRFDRKQLRIKLERLEKTDPAVITRKAVAELQVIYAGGNTVPWLRFSTSGSVPMPAQATKAFRKAFLDLLDFCDEKNIPVHLPVETSRKAAWYRRLVGSRCVVRESAVSVRRFITAQCPVSAVAGTMDMTRIERIAASKALAAQRAKATGRKVVVCPAVADFYLNNRPHALSKAKCGNCTVCPNAAVDVIYPLH